MAGLTRRDLLKYLPSSEAERALFYTSMDKLNQVAPAGLIASENLAQCFSWNDTEEGFDYWQKVYNEQKWREANPEGDFIFIKSGGEHSYIIKTEKDWFLALQFNAKMPKAEQTDILKGLIDKLNRVINE
jgi:hypothetical protein